GQLRAEGLRLSSSKIWDDARGTGLAAAAVNLSGCTGALISAEGLVITNHHCVFSIIQEHATKDRNLLADGFLARKRSDELPGKAARLQVPKKFTDVTAQILAAVPAGADDLARFVAIDRKQKELVRDCEARPATRCRVATFDGGLVYLLVEAMELADVRLVYAPPLGVGNYGGEVDNWSWPRHTGDFAIVRGYVAKSGLPAPSSADNVPLVPTTWLPVSTTGVGPDDFVMILGYPGTTFREELADEMAFRRSEQYPRILDLYGHYSAIIEAITDPEGKLALASQHKSILNRLKNSKGQLAGLARGKTIEKQVAFEAEIVARASRRKDGAEALAARKALLEELELARRSYDRELLLSTFGAGARALWLASTVARLSTERQKPDLERDPELMDRELPRLTERLEREQRNLFAPADQKLLLAWVTRAQALAPGQRIDAVDKTFGAAPSAEVEKKIADLYARTKVLDPEARKKMIGAKPEELRALKDPLLDFGFGVAAELDRLKETRDRRAGASSRLRPAWRRAVLAMARGPVAPDANGTLRISYGKVRGYAPKDGAFYTPQTTLSGLVAKHTGAEPFDAPEKLRAAVTAGKLGRWRDPRLGDVPVCFLSDVDTTGGNSGSPIVDGRGRLVGVNFDRVWENVANDFGYDPNVARNISVDIRYVLWLLDQVEDAKELLAELGVR
ncbi:S46 family peptidase, partial [Myxococcota bacterium]|nr:S46 family peptidase [Myxococcota bacterium]